MSLWETGGSAEGGTAVINLEKNPPMFRKHDNFGNDKAKLHKTVKHIQRSKSSLKEHEGVHHS